MVISHVTKVPFESVKMIGKAIFRLSDTTDVVRDHAINRLEASNHGFTDPLFP